MFRSLWAGAQPLIRAQTGWWKQNPRTWWRAGVGFRNRFL